MVNFYISNSKCCSKCLCRVYVFQIDENCLLQDNPDDQFSLKWNNFQSNLATGFRDLLEEEVMVDVTVAAEGKFVQAHKVILSICSPYFKDLFKVRNDFIFIQGHVWWPLALATWRWRLFNTPHCMLFFYIAGLLASYSHIIMYCIVCFCFWLLKFVDFYNKFGEASYLFIFRKYFFLM